MAFKYLIYVTETADHLCEGGVYTDDHDLLDAQDAFEGYCGNTFAQGQHNASINNNYARPGTRYELRDNLDGVAAIDPDVRSSLVEWQLAAIA